MSQPDASQSRESQDETMMRLALEEAQLAAEMGEVPVGAVVHREGHVIARAHNQREMDQDPTAHAEILALRQAASVLGSWRLEDCELVVTLEPCPMCAGALVNARIARLVYGAADPKMGCVHTLHALCDDPQFNHRMEIKSGVQAQACAQILVDFFKARRTR
jgi:tRNA(adenine34) deaminase